MPEKCTDRALVYHSAYGHNMAAAVLCFSAVLVVILGCTGATSVTARFRCPTTCACLGSMVDCSQRGLTEIPEDLPHWVTILELQSNNIREIPGTAFQGIRKLEELDLSDNQLSSVNSSLSQQIPGLHTLKLAHNELVDIPLFEQHMGLTKLILNHNQIQQIDKQALENLPQLRTLDLNFNQIHRLHKGMFPLLPSLHQLFLNNNNVEWLEEGALDNLTSLEWLKLNKNKLRQLTKNIFQKLKNLKHLELNKNRLREIIGLTFNGLDSLLSLKLRRNKISELKDGAFWRLDQIQNLELDHNNITMVRKGWLYGLSSLQQLTLSHNRISQIEQDSDVWGSTRLSKLDLSHNQLEKVGDGIFEKLASLQDLHLQHNHIKTISPAAFQGMAALHNLELGNNQISWTVEDTAGLFEGLVSLTKLGLHANRIKTISKRAFQGLERLKHLDLTDNPIATIQSNAFALMAVLQELRFNTTSLLCDCDLEWLPKWLKVTGFQMSVLAKCGHPEALRGSSIFDVQTTDFDCADIPKPVIVTDPQTQVARKGSNLTLLCEAVSSSSKLQVKWKKDNQVLMNENIENLATTNDGQVVRLTSKLHMMNVQDENAGTYQCVVSDDHDLVSCYSQRAKVSVSVFPVFVKKPKDVTVKASSTARLECAATGQPPPQIAWQKDGGNDFPAARERRMHVMPQDDVFLIIKVTTNDQGVYSCRADNEAGTIIANATLNVLEKPSFVKRMEDKVIVHGKTTVLECMASGSPKPKLEWLKDDQPLVASQRHFFTAEDQLLIIVQTKRSDEGKYTCKMSNTIGTEKGDSNVKVISLDNLNYPEGPSEYYQDDSTTTGIIIIAVVCCVVGTSLVWVIIIYQTRKKSEEYSSTPTDETTLAEGTPSTPYHSSEKEGSSPPGIATHYTTSYKYANGDVGNGGLAFTQAKQRMAAIFPSDVDDDDHRQSVPLTQDEQQLAQSSDNSLNGLQRRPHSDCETVPSSSPSTSSTRSTTLLQTFHPHSAASQADSDCVALPNGSECPREYVTVEQGAPCNPHTSARPARYIESHTAQDGYHGSQPPGRDSYGTYPVSDYASDCASDTDGVSSHDRSAHFPPTHHNSSFNSSLPHADPQRSPCSSIEPATCTQPCHDSSSPPTPETSTSSPHGHALPHPQHPQQDCTVIPEGTTYPYGQMNGAFKSRLVPV